MINHAVDNEYLRNFDLTLNHDCLFMHQINTRSIQCLVLPKKVVYVPMPQVASQGGHHASQCVLFQPSSEDIESEVGGEEDVRVG
jgi:hypothetical protein